MKISVRPLALALALCLLLLLPTAASAYVLWDYSYYKTYLDVYNGYLPDAYKTALSSAASSWNGKPQPTYVAAGSSGANSIEVRSLGTGTYGQYGSLSRDSTNYPKHQVTRFFIYLNGDKLDGATATVKRSVITHELGHAAGLTDCSTSAAIMNNGRDRTTVYTLQTDDVNGIVANWKR